MDGVRGTAHLGGKRCLIVEDAAILANAERRFLERLGADVTTVPSFAAGRKAIDAGGWDLIILDVGLPDGDGRALVAAATSLVPRPMVLVVSGLLNRASALALQGMGAIVMDKVRLGEHLPHALAAATSRFDAARDAPGPTSEPIAALGPPRPPELTPRPASSPPQPLEASARSLIAQYAATHGLSTRELEVFELSVQGLSDKDAAVALGIAHSTIRAHWRQIAAKTSHKSQRDVLKHFARSLVASGSRQP